MSVPFLPESAPFTIEQRSWLNGFFAGLASGGSSSIAAPAVAEAGSAVATLPAPAEDEDFPWHDAALSMDERMTLADGKKPERQLMAAMAQLDCGSCGYLCQTYAEAIASGADKDLTKCSPGGKETSKKLKELVVQLNVSAGSKPQAAPGAGEPTAAPHVAGLVSRDNPHAAPLLRSRRLSGEASQKEVRHVEFNLKGSPVKYKAGDALGVWPENDLETVTQIIERLGATGAEECHTIDGRDTSLFEALRRERVVTQPTESLIELLVESATDAEEAKRAQGWLLTEHGEPLTDVDVLDVLLNVSSAKPSIPDFIGALAKLQPRLYSISSSPNAHENQVHLTVGAVRYAGKSGRTMRGVASTFLADRVRPGEKVRVFVHESKSFGLPKAGDTPIIMVGPGTGIAPFRAFLHDRRAAGAKGKNWLFFGDQRRDHDFLYRDELDAMSGDGFLSKLDLAFSRDQDRKVYVQHRMQEQGAELWRWLNEGAHFYVCGDAQRMAKDVDDTLKKVVAEHGRMSEDDAKAYVTKLGKEGRYQRDVY